MNRIQTVEAPDEFKKYGFTYYLIQKEGKKALYCQIHEEQIVGYEVQLMHSAQHKFPKHEDFGYTAWSFRNEQKAKEFFDELTTGVGGQTELPF